MEIMFFLEEYKEDLIKGFKNLIVCTDDKVGKYKEGKRYRAGSYDGDEWDVVLEVTEIIQTDMKFLDEYGVVEKEKKRILDEMKSGFVEVIRFRLIRE